MKTKRRGLRIYRCDKCGKIDAIQTPPYSRLHGILKGEICICDPEDICVWKFLERFKGNRDVQRFLEKLPKGHPKRVAVKG